MTIAIDKRVLDLPLDVAFDFIEDFWYSVIV
jgi:hypothetical protein